jgi:DNA-binding protein H-NS
MSKIMNFDAMSVDEMWQLHEEISRVLAVRLTSEKQALEKQLARLRGEKEIRRLDPAEQPPLKDSSHTRRKYPRVFPKYQNPNKPSETWSGRGKQPRWLAAALENGHTIEEFVMGIPKTNRNRRRRK